MSVLPASLSLFFVALLCVAGASAYEMDPLGPTPADEAVILPAPGGPNVEPVSLGKVKFPELKQIFDQSTAPTEQSLIGDWGMSGYADVHFGFGNKKNCYSVRRCLNNDGTQMVIRFGVQKERKTGTEKFVASFLTWGSRNDSQGPYKAALDQSRAAVVTALYASGGQSKTSFAFDCRIMKDNTSKMICGLTLRLSPEDYQTSTQEQRSLNRTMSGMAVFDRLY